MNKRSVIVALCDIASAPYYFRAYNYTENRQVQSDCHPKWTDDENLDLPTGYMERMYLGAPLTPNVLNNSADGYQKYYNNYILSAVYKNCKKTGEFLEGIDLLKELQLTKIAEEEDGSRRKFLAEDIFLLGSTALIMPSKFLSVLRKAKFGVTSIWANLHRHTLRPLKLHLLKRMLPVILATQRKTWCVQNSIRF